MKALPFVWLLLTSIAVNGQARIFGILKYKGTGKPSAGVTLTLYESGSKKVLAYTVSDAKGQYQLRFASTSDSVVLIVSALNVKTETKTFANTNREMNFELSPNSFTLKEVKIKPPRLRQIGDTLSYLVDGFKSQNDRTIGDVLKKLPGIEVKDNGQILYNNRPINKFYIEDKDLLQGRYGIATNNLEAKDVAVVQVLENHQPVKVLKNREFSPDAALNLKLKESAKGILIGNAQLGAGLSPLLWNNELFSMYFNKARQNINTYKGNNSGNDLTFELKSLYGEETGAGKDDTELAIQSPGTPGIGNRRYLLNRSHNFSINNLWSFAKDYQLTADVSYLNDKEEKSSYSKSEYYLSEDSLLTVEERLSSSAMVNELDGSFLLNANKEKFYLDNLLKVTGKWSMEKGLAASREDIHQRLNNPELEITNAFKSVRRRNKGIITLQSFNEYRQKPQSLSIQPYIENGFFSADSDLEFVKQSLSNRRFFSSSSFGVGFGTKAWKHDYEIGIKAEVQHLNSALVTGNNDEPLTRNSDSLKNSRKWSNYEGYINTGVAYQQKQLRVAFHLPLIINYINIDDRLSERRTINKQMFVNPELSFRYEVSPKLNVRGTARYTTERGSPATTYTGYILQNYRSISKNESQLPKQKIQVYQLETYYRHPIRAVFANLHMRYAINKTDLLYGYEYWGITNLRKTYPINNETRTVTIDGRLSKGLDVIASTVSISARTSSAKASVINEGKSVAYRNNQYSVRPEITCTMNRWSNTSLSSEFSRSFTEIENGGDHLRPIRSSRLQGQLNLLPSKRISIGIAHDLFFTNAIQSGSRKMNFSDVLLKYKTAHWELTTEYSNIFNSRKYVSASYNTISTFYYVYDLRPSQLLVKLRLKIK